MVYLFLADGFEIIEALSPIDMLRRAEIEVLTVGVTGKTVESSCGVKVEADITIDEFEYKNVQALILPGGLNGTLNLEANDAVQSALDKAKEDKALICAICAAPSILGHKGFLVDRNAVAFPGFEKELKGACISNEYVVKDENFITAKGAGVSVDFGLEIVKALTNQETANKIRSTIQCRENLN